MEIYKFRYPMVIFPAGCFLGDFHLISILVKLLFAELSFATSIYKKAVTEIIRGKTA